MVSKTEDLLIKTVKGPAIKRAQAVASFDPSILQTSRVSSAPQMAQAIPVVDISEYEQYLTLPGQVPGLTTTQGRVDWWKSRRDLFPKLAPVAIAYLLTPRSAAQAERTFSLLGHIQTDDRLNMRDDTLQALTFVYINHKLFTIA